MKLGFDQIKDKVLSGQRISDEEALYLFRFPDLMALGALADEVNKKKNKNFAYYNINRHVNPTNICVMSCKFCSFSRKPGDEGAYAYSLDQIVEKVQDASKQGATEIHMVGGLHPRWNLDYFKNILATLKEKFPHLHLKGFTAVEIDWLAKRSRKTVDAVLTELQEAGLGSMPGGGAEIFHDEIREQITAKLSTEDWLDIHRKAHKLGMRSNCTMLYGHVETFEHRVYHFKKLRELQDETSGFNAFIPLSFQPHNNEMGISRYTFGSDDLRTIAVARIYLDNFIHIKSYWIMLGQDIAQLALSFGADDLDGTVIQEKISNMAGGRSGVHMSACRIQQLIERVGKIPVERDTLYHARVSEEKLIQLTKSYQGLSEADFFAEMTELRIFLQKREEKDRLAEKQLNFVKKAFLESHYIFQRLLVKKDLDRDPRSINILPVYETLESSETADVTKRQAAAVLIKSDYLNQHLLDKFDHHITLRDLGVFLRFCKSQYQVKRFAIEDLNLLQKACGDEAYSEQLWQLLASEGLIRASFIIDKELIINETKEQIAFATKYDVPSELTVVLKTNSDHSLDLETFVHDLSFAILLERHAEGVQVISLEAREDSYLMPVEYLKALAIVQFTLPQSIQVAANYISLPTLSPEKGKGSSHHNPRDKYLGLLGYYGAESLGMIPINRHHLKDVEETLQYEYWRLLKNI